MENRVDFKTYLQKVGITEKVFDIAFFDDFCFRFVLVEKKPKISK